MQLVKVIFNSTKENEIKWNLISEDMDFLYSIYPLGITNSYL